MLNPYTGREQTLAKHFILERYLERLAFKLLEGGHPALTYVDAFSGPWKSQTADFSDTSFMVAIRILKRAHRSFQERGKPKEIRCFFVEEDPSAHKQLASAVMAHNDPIHGFHVQTYGGAFEDAVQSVKGLIGQSFALIFIDPTGWTGFDFNRIAPVIRHEPGEVLANFMYDHIGRFVSSDDPKIISSFDSILGGPNWKSRLEKNLPPGRAAEKLFIENLSKIGRFNYVLSTRIEKTTVNRPHFSLVYGTRSSMGLKVFREVEHAALSAHDKQRAEVKRAKKEAKTRQASLFEASELPEVGSFEEIVEDNRKSARSWIASRLHDWGPIKFDELCAQALLTFILREKDVKDICVDLAKDGLISAPWREETPKKAKPNDRHLIELATRKSPLL